MNNQEKGILYEKYIKNIIINNLNKPAYLWNECPENILIENNLIHSHNELRLIRKDIKEGFIHNYRDIGIDIIQIEDENKCSIIQCKNGYSNGLVVNDIAGIMMRTAFSNNDTITYIYYTNSLSKNIISTSIISLNVSNIDCSNDLSLLLSSNKNKVNFIKLPFKNSENNNSDNNNEIKPYNYQLNAYNKIKEYFNENNRSILSLPCGCGKTYTSYLISNDYKQIILISPLRSSAEQNLERYIEYGYNKDKTLLVDSDGNRDIDYIKTFIINNNNDFIISTTYASMDIISLYLDLFNNSLFIIDEFHNLSKANISDELNSIYKLLISNHKILFMSATPRIYDIEYDDIMEDENYIGEIVYKMNFNEAIDNKYITDYKIWLPSIHENNDDLIQELSIYEIDNLIKNRCIYLYSCIINNGSRKTIIYCKDNNDMIALIDCFQKLNDFYNIDYDIYHINCDDNNKKRKEVINNFSNNNDKIQLLFNIRILNECIDIPECDSIYISYPPKNKITTIQRINRATRIDKNNPFKIANIYIWCNEYEEILESLSSIKEFDIMFKDKIKLNSINFYNEKSKNNIKLVENDKETINNYIIGVKEFKQYNWKEKLQLVIDYIKENNKLPSTRHKNKNIKSLGQWLSQQKNNNNKNINIMKNEEIKKEWEQFINEYEHFFKSNEEIWKDNLNKVIDYIKENNKLPSSIDKDKNIKSLGQWLSHQKNNNNKNINIMKNEEIKKEWELFINEYEHFFKSNEEIWYDTLNKVIDYIKENNKLPSTRDKNKNIKSLGEFINTQKQNYKKYEGIMKIKEIREEWEQFINEYEHFFKSNEEIWKDNLNKVINYINENNKLPSSIDKDKNNASLGRWLSNQKKSYKNNDNIMKDEDIKKEWEAFINNYEEYFKTNQEIWRDNLIKVINYINENNKLPSSINKDKNIKSLRQWLSTQKQKYKNNERIMKNEEIKKEWEAFINDYEVLFK